MRQQKWYHGRVPQPLITLNPAQAQAVAHQDGPLLLLAGAGAGKTKTIAHRIQALIEKGVAPEAILAITFTNKAAQEMRERVLTLLGLGPASPGATPILKPVPFVSTFHSLGVYLLRQHAAILGLDRFFSIYDKSESLTVLKQVVKSLGIDDKQYEPRRLLHYISRLKGQGQAVGDFVGQTTKDSYQRLVATVWQGYEGRLHQDKALDFDDLLLKTTELLTTQPLILAHYQARWRYIHIDEYQDTNALQYQLVTLLAARHQNLCAVGDGDQSIYSWRGADNRNILNFEKDYPQATVILLEENYRSTKNILAAAGAVIKKNKKRHEKNLFTNNAVGEKITLYQAWSESAEARFVAETCATAIAQGRPAGELAVLYRANFQSRVLEEAFLEQQVPYLVLGTRFYERKEIKDVLAFIKAALNPADRASLKRIINIPPRGIGEKTLEKIWAGQAEALPPRMREKIAAFQQLLAAIRQKISTHSASEVTRFIVKETKLGDTLTQGTDEDAERLENIKELVSLSLRYDQAEVGEGIMQLVTDASLASDQDQLEKGGGGVRLMTVHAAKGLEFGTVFITGLEQNLFPHQGMGDGEKRDEEEERRLFYVALTRAKQKLFLTLAQTRTIFGTTQFNAPSEFLADISQDLLEEVNEQGALGPTTNYIDF